MKSKPKVINHKKLVAFVFSIIQKRVCLISEKLEKLNCQKTVAEKN